MKRILIIKPSSLGDIMHALQVVASIREQMKNEELEISWVVRDIFADIIKSTSLVDKIFIYHRNNGLKGLFFLGKEIAKAGEFDFILDMQGLARSAFMAFMAKGKRKIGRRDGREFSRLFFSEYSDFPQKGFKKSHAVEVLLKFLPVIGLKEELIGHFSFDKLNKSEFYKENLSKIDNPILLFPDSRREEKKWPYFNELAEQLLEKFPNEKICIIGQDNPEKFDYLTKNPNCFNFIKKTNLNDVIGLIQKAQYCVTNDSGPMHIAASIKKPVLGIFGPTSPELYGPYSLTDLGNKILVAPFGDLKKLSPEIVFETIAKHKIELSE